VNNSSSNLVGPIVVSGIVLLGFILISFLAMKPEFSGVKQEVVLFLLGSWSGMAGIAVAYWLGSSAGSKNKDDVIQSMQQNSDARDVKDAKTAWDAKP
jgi:hypothetical protein